MSSHRPMIYAATNSSRAVFAADPFVVADDRKPLMMSQMASVSSQAKIGITTMPAQAGRRS